METRSKRRSRARRSSTLLASLVQVLVDSGHVQVAEVGKLAQTCREVNQACMEDDIWASLCQQEWPTVASIPESCVDTRGHRWMYRQWCSGPAAKRRPPANRLGPPSCTVDQMQLHLNVKYKGVPVFSKVFTGQELGDLLNESENLCLDPPFSIGRAEWTFTDEDRTEYMNNAESRGLSVGCANFDPNDFRVRGHLLRTNDSSMCCLHDSSDREGITRDGVLHKLPLYVHPVIRHHQGVEGIISPRCDFDLSRDQEGGVIVTGPLFVHDFRGLPMRHSMAATEIRNRYPHSVDFSSVLGLRVVPGGDLALAWVSFAAVGLPKDGGRATLKPFMNQEEERDHGVTLLHILSGLQGTEFDDDA